MKNKTLTLNKFQTNSIKILVSISMFFLVLVLSNYIDSIKNFMIYNILGSFLSAITLLFVLIKNNKIIKISKKILILSFFIATYSMYYFLNININWIRLLIMKFSSNNLCNVFIFGLGILALPALIFFCYLFLKKIFPKVKKFVLNLEKTEKKYLLIIFFLSFLLSIFICFFTTAFTFDTSKYSPYNIVFTSDSSLVAKDDAFINFSHPENDLRQPLFGVFAFPFGIIAHFLSNFIFMTNGQSYWLMLIVGQFLLNAITIIMLGKLLKIEDKYKKYFYLLFSVSFPYLVFSLTLEQYSISLFYLILTIYIANNYKGINYLYVGATGTLLTSGIIFPLITKFKSIKQWIKDVFKCFLAFVGTIIFSGQFIQILSIPYKIEVYSQYTGDIFTMKEKMYKFIEFISSIFVGSNGYVMTGVGYPAYRLSIPDKINYFGLIIFILIVISFILNRKNKIARLSFFWVLFSFIVLVLIGWGQKENGLILYSLYFSWAYLVLLYLLIKKIFIKEYIFKLAMIFIILLMAYFNFSEFIRIISFAIKYY